jgi:hypothetical protein
MRKLLAAIAIVFVATSSASAQQAAGATASITIGTTLYLSATGTTVSFNAPTEADFNAGYINGSTTTSIQYAGNVRHSVVAWTAATKMTGTLGLGGAIDPVNANKAVSDLQWSIDAGVTRTGFVASTTSLTGGKIVNQHARGDSRLTPASVVYRMLLSYATDTPGKYDLGFTYTIIAD